MSKFSFLSGNIINPIKRHTASVKIEHEIPDDELMDYIMDRFSEIESRDRSVSDVVIHPWTYYRIARMFSSYFDVSSTLRLNEHGMRGIFLGARVWTYDNCSKKEIKCYHDHDPMLDRDFPSVANSKAQLGF